jgi:hypothetical protein
MKQTDKDIEIFEELRNISGIPIEQIVSVFNGLLTYATMAYLEKEKVFIPMLGEVFLKYQGEVVEGQQEKANVTGFFIPHDELRKIIGQLEDVKQGSDSKKFLEVDIVKFYKGLIQKKLKKEFNGE